MTDVEQDQKDLRLGAQVDRYTIVRLLGKGGMGAVYEARHTRLARRVAIKFLLPDLASRAEVLRRFENEAVAAGGLEHPNLVAVIDLGRAADGSPYLVMEFLEGEDCARLLRRLELLPVSRAVNVALQACRGVAVAHDAGIVHRDLKPENLFVTDVGDGSDQIKVLDFGIAKLRPVEGQVSTRTGSTFGTTHYMSPEQARGAREIDARTDVWSLGVVLYELLAGRKPFDGDQPLNVVHQILTATPPALDALRPGLPRALVAAIDTALRKDPDERFPTVRDMAVALEPFATRAATREVDAALTTTGLSAAATGERPAARRALGRPLGTVLALALAGVGVMTVSIASTRGKSAASAAPPVVAPALLPVTATPSVPPATPAAPPPVTVAAATPAAAVSEQSGQSGHGKKSGAATRLSHSGEGRTAASASDGTGGGAGASRGRPASHARPALTLDPNPY